MNGWETHGTIYDTEVVERFNEPQRCPQCEETLDKCKCCLECEHTQYQCECE